MNRGFHPILLIPTQSRQIEVVDAKLCRHELVQQRAEQRGEGGIFAAVESEL